jgi:uncharacterized protein (DUF885 family)
VGPSGSTRLPSGGALPLAILERLVDDWIAAQRLR